MVAAIRTMDDIITERFKDFGPVRGKRETAKLKAQVVLERRIKDAKDVGRPMTSNEMRLEAVRVARAVEEQAISARTLEDLLPTERGPGKEGTIIRDADGNVAGVYVNEKDIRLTDDSFKRAIAMAKRKGWTKEQLVAWLKKNRYVVD